MTVRYAFRPNTRITIPDGAFRYREAIGLGYLFMSEEDGSSRFFPYAEIEGLYAAGKLQRHGTKPLNGHDRTGGLAPDQVLTPQEAARAHYCRLWDANPCSRSTRPLQAFINHHHPAAVKKGVTYKPSPGMVARALRSRGEMGRRPSGAMLTRTGKVPRASQLHPFVNQALDYVVAWFWAERAREYHEAHALLEHMVRLRNACFRTKKITGGHVWEPAEAPSKETTRIRIHEAECRRFYAAKFDERAAKLRFDGSVPTLEANYALDMIVIDSTVVDGFCVMREATATPLGRPTLYAAVDVRSRMTVAWHLSFEPPSLYGVMALMKRIVTPNPSGIWGRPKTVVLDNGWENVSPSFQEACESAGINLHWAPIKTPEYKAIVERNFRTLNGAVFHKLLGGSVPLPPHAMRLLGLDPQHDKCITLEDLEEQLEYVCRQRLAKRKQRGIGEVPQVVWDKDMRNRGREVVDDLPALVAHFGQVETLTLTRSGVVTKDGLRFSDRVAVTQLLDDLAKEVPVRERRKGSATAKVKVIVFPDDITQARVWNHHRREYVTLGNVHARFARECASRWEYRVVKGMVDEEAKEFDTEEARMARLLRARRLIEGASPTLRDKAAKRQRALLAGRKAKPEGDLVMEGHAPASPDGREPIIEVPTNIASVVATDDGQAVKGHQRGGKAAVEKARRTRARKKEEKARDEESVNEGQAERWEEGNPEATGKGNSPGTPRQAGRSGKTGKSSSRSAAPATQGTKNVDPYENIDWMDS